MNHYVVALMTVMSVTAILIQLVAVFKAFRPSQDNLYATETVQETIQNLISKAVETASTKPTKDCQETARSVIVEIYDNYSILPHRASTTGEASILAFYRCVDNDFNVHTLDFEFYDDADEEGENTVVVVLSDGKKVRSAEKSLDHNHFDELIKEFSRYL